MVSSVEKRLQEWFPSVQNFCFLYSTLELSSTKPTQPSSFGGDHSGSQSSNHCPNSWSCPLVHGCSELLLLLHHRGSSWESPARIYSIFSRHAQHCAEILEDLTLTPLVGTPWTPTQNQEVQVVGDIWLPHHQLPTFFLGVSPAERIPQYYANASGLHLQRD